MKERNRFLFVVAHPDDEVITCGGLLSEVGEESTVLLATNRYDDMELVYERMTQFKEVMNVCGASYDSLKMEAYRFSHSQRDSIEKIREYASKSEVVITHHPNDFNRDHSELSKMVILSTRELSCSVLFMNSYAPESIRDFRGSMRYRYSSKKKGELLDIYNDRRYNKYYVLCKDSMSSFDGKSYVELYEPYRVNLSYECIISKSSRANDECQEDA